MTEGVTRTEKRGAVVAIARVSVAALFGYALATKLIDPRQFRTMNAKMVRVVSEFALRLRTEICWTSGVDVRSFHDA